MGWFDWLRKPKASVSLPQLSYDIAYRVLPHYAFEDLNKLIELCVNTPNAAGPFFYLMAAQMREIEPNIEDAKKFRWHLGTLSSGSEYFALEYPIPPPVDMSHMSVEDIVSNKNQIVLAPHFCVVVRNDAASKADYYILGQAPIDGGTTLRCILPDGANCNLGPGPAPSLPGFIKAIEGLRKD